MLTHLVMNYDLFMVYADNTLLVRDAFFCPFRVRWFRALCLVRIPAAAALGFDELEQW